MLGLGATAHADRADQLFKKGKKLLGEKKYAEACTAFEQSDKLDPGIGAKLNVARCYEEWGKLATALRWYGDAEHMAASGHDDREAKIHERIAALEPDVPRLTVSLPPGAITFHLVVKLDGVELELAALGVERRVDPGAHKVETFVDDVRHEKVVPLERGGSSEVTLDVPVRTSKRVKRVAPEAEADPVRTRRLVGLGVSGAGAVAIGIAGIVTLRARGDYKHALDVHCNGVKDMCDDVGQAATHGARRRANISTGVAIAGLGAIAGGLYLYFTAQQAAPAAASEHALYLAPVVGGDGTGVVLGGAF
jgi:tetratricopeptide (TPR) repeat protein